MSVQHCWFWKTSSSFLNLCNNRPIRDHFNCGSERSVKSFPNNSDDLSLQFSGFIKISCREWSQFFVQFSHCQQNLNAMWLFHVWSQKYKQMCDKPLFSPKVIGCPFSFLRRAVLSILFIFAPSAGEEWKNGCPTWSVHDKITWILKPTKGFGQSFKDLYSQRFKSCLLLLDSVSLQLHQVLVGFTSATNQH